MNTLIWQCPLQLFLLLSSTNRAPEIFLGLPISGAIDLWGLGCILSFLYLSEELFNVHCQYQMVSNLIYLDWNAQLLTHCTRQLFKPNQSLAVGWCDSLYSLSRWRAWSMSWANQMTTSSLQENTPLCSSIRTTPGTTLDGRSRYF